MAVRWDLAAESGLGKTLASCWQGLGWALTRSPGQAHGIFHARSPRHLQHLPRDYALAIRWLRPSFLIRDHWTPGRKGRDFHGITTLRYVDQGEAAVHAARSGKRAHV